jgi:hypothetical protein
MVMFEQCAWKFYILKVKKSVSEGQTTQMKDGNEVHRALELAVKEGISLPDKYKGMAPIVESIRNTPGTKLVEWKFGLTRNWTECDYFDKANVWIRGRLDVGVVGTENAVVFDYKTGKRKPELEELGLFSIPVFVRYPYLKKVKTGYIWLAENKIDPATYTPGDLPHLKELFGMYTRRIEDALKSGDERRFPKIPGGLCKWCPVGRENCEYWVSRKGEG